MTSHVRVGWKVSGVRISVFYASSQQKWEVPGKFCHNKIRVCPYGDIDRREYFENRDTRERTHLFRILLDHMPTITCVITLTQRVREPELDQRRVVLRDVAERAAARTRRDRQLCRRGKEAGQGVGETKEEEEQRGRMTGVVLSCSGPSGPPIAFPRSPKAPLC